MNILYVIFTHNRELILQECLRTLFENNNTKPDHVAIIDDASGIPLKNKLYYNHISASISTDIFSFRNNVGYAKTFGLGLHLAELYNPNYVCLIESDYIFRKHGLDEVFEVFHSPLGSDLAGIAGYSHPDFFNKHSTDVIYPKLLEKDFGKDNLNRDILFKPFPFRSSFGDIQLQYTSNSCGTIYLNWRLIQNIRKMFPSASQEWIDKSLNKGNINNVLNDGAFSHGLSYLWQEYQKQRNFDTDKQSALIDILPSVANHVCGDGINGKSIKEGQTFVSSPSFPKDYNIYGCK